MQIKSISFRRVLLGASLLFLLNGCAAHVYIPGNRFMSPEASGHFLGGDFKVGIGGTTDVQVADNMTSATPDTTPVLNKNSTMMIGGQLGLLPPLDLYFTSGVGTGTAFGAKLQVLGDPQNEAKAGNFSLAIAGGLVSGDEKQSVDMDDIKGSANVNYSGWEGIASIGYRPFDILLVYLSPFSTRVNGKIRVERTVANVTSTTATPDGYGDMRGASLGLRFGSNFFLNAEASITEAIWTRTVPSEANSKKFTDHALGVAVGGSW